VKILEAALAMEHEKIVFALVWLSL